MLLEDQRGGCSHLTTHSTPSDPTGCSDTSSTDGTAISPGIAAREQVLLITSLAVSLHIP